MSRRQFNGARNKLDVNNRVQLRIVRKRLKVSDKQLADLIRTAGNSIAAVSKEAGSQRRLSLPATRLPQAKAIEAVQESAVEPEAV